jgi:hypothetical protein
MTNFLHILPVFYSGLEVIHDRHGRYEKVKRNITFNDMPFLRARVSVKDVDGAINLMPNHKVTITKAFPNSNYLVGGCKGSKVGWYVPIPENLDHLNICIAWELEYERSGKMTLVRPVHHQIRLNLLPGEGRIYSMDASTWMSCSEAPVNSMAKAVLTKDLLSDYRREKTVSSFIQSRGVLTIEESIDIDICVNPHPDNHGGGYGLWTWSEGKIEAFLTEQN